MSEQQLKTPRMSEKILLIGLRKSFWTGAKVDKEVSDETCAQKGAAQGSGVWWTHYVPKNILEPLRKEQSRVDRVVKSFTKPWGDDGRRALLASKFLEFTSAFRAAMVPYDAKKQEFLEVTYPDARVTKQARLNELGKNIQMPMPEEIAGKFDIRLTVEPMPEVEDFRLKAGDDAMSAIVAEAEETHKARVHDLMYGIWEGLLDIVEAMEVRLSSDKTTKHGKASAFKDCWPAKLKDYCKKLGDWNLTGDPQLEECCKQAMEKLAKLNPVHVRENKALGKAAAKDAQELISKMKSYMSA